MKAIANNKLNTLRIVASPDERELVLLSQKGDQRAQYRLYRKYVAAMYNIAVRMVVNPTDAEDVTQETFAKVFNNLKAFKGESTLGAWIKRICINTALNFIKRHRKVNWVEFSEEQDSKVEPEVFLEEEVAKVEIIHRAIKTLPDGCRVVFNLYQMEGFQHKEIAEILDISESTSKTQYRRAKRLLKEALT